MHTSDTAQTKLVLTPEEGKETTLRKLEESSLEVLWDAILALQVQLYFKKEVAYIEKTMPWWRQVDTVVDFGSGKAGICPKAHFLSTMGEAIWA